MTTETAAQNTGPRIIAGLEGLRACAGSDLGVSDWFAIDQSAIDAFAQLTGDKQWIHTDPARAATGPYGGTIAHGFLTLGLATELLWNVAVVENGGTILNYGLNKVRFPAPLPVGSRVRMHVSVLSVNDVPGGLEAVYHLVYETEGQAKPPCVADMVFRYYPDPG